MEENKTPSSNISEHSSNTPAHNYENKRVRGLQNNEPLKQKENYSLEGKKQPELDREGYEKRMDKREENLKKQNASLNTPEKKIDKPNIKTKTTKAPVFATIAKGAGKKVGQFGLKLIPYVGTGITLYEGYELTKDAYEYLKGSSDLQKELQELHEQHPDEFPPPPSLDDIDETSFFSKENKEVIAKNEPQEKQTESPDQEKEDLFITMQEFQDNRPAFLANLDKDKEQQIELSKQFENQLELTSKDSEKENLLATMQEFQNQQPEFLVDIDKETHIETPEIESEKIENLQLGETSTDNQIATDIEQTDLEMLQSIGSDNNEIVDTETTDQKNDLILAMGEFQDKRPDFLNEINEDKEYELTDLSFYGDDSGYESDEGGDDGGAADGGGGDGD